MKRKIAASTLAVALAVGGLMWASPAMADEGVPPQEAITEPTTATAEGPAESSTDKVPAEVTEPEEDKGGYDKKVWVCKYVGTPGVDEVLKDGKNPIEVSVHTLKGFEGNFPWQFPDAQGRSIAVGWSWDKVVCPEPEGPPPVLTVPTAPTWVDTCEKGDAHWEYADTKDYTYEVWDFGKYKYIRAVAAEGVTLTGQVEWFDFEKPQVCPIEVPIPALYNADPTPPTCDLAGSFSLDETFPNVTLALTPEFDGPGEYLLTADTAEGYTFPDGTTHKERTITVEGPLGYQSEDAELPCYLAPPVPVTLEMPVIEDVCGTEDDSVEIPVDAEDRVVYTWQSDDVNSDAYDDIRATVQPGYVVETVPAGWESVGEGVYIYVTEFSDEACPTTTPNTPAKPATAGLAATGGGDVSPLVPFAGAITVALGIVLLAMRRFARR